MERNSYQFTEVEERIFAIVEGRAPLSEAPRATSNLIHETWPLLEKVLEAYRRPSAVATVLDEERLYRNLARKALGLVVRGREGRLCDTKVRFDRSDGVTLSVPLRAILRGLVRDQLRTERGRGDKHERAHKEMEVLREPEPLAPRIAYQKELRKLLPTALADLRPPRSLFVVLATTDYAEDQWNPRTVDGLRALAGYAGFTGRMVERIIARARRGGIIADTCRAEGQRLSLTEVGALLDIGTARVSQIRSAAFVLLRERLKEAC
ncbi:hypothetical protein JL100_030335 (plasmid) [Skermanella mucosa]|uniref:hypothetical protein n=1 Tax=Skermanella mucosa TaxID=1789672 RepID=UPI00192BB0ED|nr:hypothetical protein [Skermanella mucosa]UEM24528.1 hypothetical protein JL100_030335 [Skermanella mucosa]